MKKQPDYRLPHLLQKGDQIWVGQEIYTISQEEPLGLGGTSVLYAATRTNSHLQYAIKEWFPSGTDKFHRAGGIICPADPTDAAAHSLWNQHRLYLENERELGQRIRNTTSKAIGIWETLTPSAIVTGGETYRQVSQGIFCVLERMDQKGVTFQQLLAHIKEKPRPGFPLKTGGLPNVHTTALVMEQVLLVLQSVHEAGFLFGDIHDGNVFFSDCRLEQGDVGVGHLLDFGCAKALTNGTQTDPVGPQIFTTPGFTPPEIMDPAKNDGTLRLTVQADLYAVGCLMLRCVLTRASIRRLGPSPLVGDDTIDEEAATRLGCSEAIRCQLNHILKKALQPDPQDRYPNAGAMLVAIQQLKVDTAPPSYNLPTYLSAPDYLVPNSRTKEVAAVTAALQRKEIVFLWGEAGIGKTETAICLANTYPTPKGAFLIHYHGSMAETIRSLAFEGYTPPEGDPHQEKDDQARLDILKKHYAGALFIVDNFDVEGKSLDDLRKEPAFRDLTALPLSLVFTTRSPVPWQPEHQLHPLSQGDLLALMRRFAPDPGIPDQALLDLIQAVGGNTLAVSLMAKTLQAAHGSLTPAALLHALRTSRLHQAHYPTVVTDQNRTFSAAPLLDHLKALLPLSLGDLDAPSLLAGCALLPSEGMAFLLFQKFLPAEQRATFQAFLHRGWLQERADHTLHIHPLVQEVIREYILEQGINCRPYLQHIEDCYQQDVWGVCTRRDSLPCWRPAQFSPTDLRQLTQVICTGADVLMPSDPHWLWFAAELLAKEGRSIPGRRYLQRATELEASQSAGWSLAMYHLGAVGAFYQYDRDLALHHGTQACTQWQQLLSHAGSPYEKEALLHRYAKTCFWLFRIYYIDFQFAVTKKQYVHQQALDLSKQILELEQQALVPDVFLQSQVHQMTADIYRRISVLKSDLSNGFFAPSAYWKLRRTYRKDLRELQLFHLQQALEAQAQMPLPNRHWHSFLLEALGDALPTEEGRSYYQQALELRLNTQAAAPQSQIHLWDTIANLYHKLGDSRKAMDYKTQKVRATGNRWYHLYLEWLFLNMQDLDKLLGQKEGFLQQLKLLLVALAAIPVGILAIIALLFVLVETIQEAIALQKQRKHDRNSTPH